MSEHGPVMVTHIDSGIQLEVTCDDLYGCGYGTVVLFDHETGEEHTVGGNEFDMEYEHNGTP
jgi:hypothetical protein